MGGKTRGGLVPTSTAHNAPQACPYNAELTLERDRQPCATLPRLPRRAAQAVGMRARYREKTPDAGEARKRSQERGRRMVALFLEGKKVAEIARIMGLTRQAVSKRLKQEGVI